MQKISKVRHNSKSTEDAVLLEVLRQRKHRQYSVPTDSNTVNSAAESESLITAMDWHALTVWTKARLRSYTQ